MASKQAFDMFNNMLKVNDRVKFYIDHAEYEGTINYISPASGNVKINSLSGEYWRKGNNTVKIIERR